MEAGTTTPNNESPAVAENTALLQAPVQELPKEKTPTLLLLGTGAALAVLFALSLTTSQAKQSEVTAIPATEVTASASAAAYEGIELQAKAAVVYDVRAQRVLFEQNAEAQLPLASLTKLMTAIVATEALAYDTVIAVDAKALELEGDSGLYADEQWRAQDLLDFMLLVSSNDSAHALAASAGAAVLQAQADPATKDFYGAFIERMNTKATEIGLTQTYFLNETGLDATSEISGGYGSAKDAAHLLAYAIESAPEALDATSYPTLTFTSQSNIAHAAENTNEITASIPGLIASKTGYTTLAGGNLVIAFDAGIGHPVIISVLGSTRDGRFSDVQKLVAATLTSFQIQK